ncbi:MAG: acyl carrier protein [Treponema sp.]|nr:acyl carrier protein [Treponema sp.]
MDRNEILNKVTEIGKELFEDDDLVLKEETVAADVDGWDSLAHLQFVGQIEDEFKIKFTMGEVQGFKNVGDLLDTMEKRLADK